MDIGLPELLIVLVIVLIVFGGGRIKTVMGEMGKGIAEFREGLKGSGSEPVASPLETKRDDPIIR